MIERILLVNENSPDREHIAVLLENQGYELIQTDNSEQALQIATEQLPDIILLGQKIYGEKKDWKRIAGMYCNRRIVQSRM